jgi:hypothetical protein
VTIRRHCVKVCRPDVRGDPRVLRLNPHREKPRPPGEKLKPHREKLDLHCEKTELQPDFCPSPEPKSAKMLSKTARQKKSWTRLLKSDLNHKES